MSRACVSSQCSGPLRARSAGINASGFPDPGGEGNGGKVVKGKTFANGEYWGKYVNWTGSILLTQDNRLIVGNVRYWDAYNVGGGIQFGPG